MNKSTAMAAVSSSNIENFALDCTRLEAFVARAGFTKEGRRRGRRDYTRDEQRFAHKIIESCWYRSTYITMGAALIILDYFNDLLNVYRFIDDRVILLPKSAIQYERLNQDVMDFLRKFSRRRFFSESLLKTGEYYFAIDYVKGISDYDNLMELLAFIEYECHQVPGGSFQKTLLGKMMQLNIMSISDFLSTAKRTQPLFL